MNVILAKTAGFCFGVNRAVEMTYEMLKNEKVVTFGPIIHNPQVIEDLESKGVRIIDSIDDTPTDSTVIVRTHGIPKDVISKLKESNRKFADATCPFVGKIHNIVNDNSDENTVVLIAGDENHPEVKGIRSYAKGETYVFSDSYDLIELSKKHPHLDKNNISVVAQTTFSVEDWQRCKENIKKLYTKAKVFDTICFATNERQREAVTLSQTCDAMLIIGGRQSSNTAKLKSTCEVNCPTYLIEHVGELKDIDLSKYQLIGITAGASTPARIIKEVHEYVRCIK